MGHPYFENIQYQEMERAPAFLCEIISEHGVAIREFEIVAIYFWEQT